MPLFQGQSTLKVGDIVDGGKTHFEHILPHSLTQVGLKRSEIVLAHRHCNDEKGDQTPWQAWGNGKNPERWKAVDKGIAQGLTPFAVLQQPIRHPQYSREGKPVYIRKVKCYGISAENAKEVIHRNRQGQVLTKYLNSKGYAWLEIHLENKFL